MAEIKTLLDDVIETEISNLKTLPIEDERRGDAIRDLVSLHKLRIEEIKAQADVEEKSERREMDSRQRKEAPGRPGRCWAACAAAWHSPCPKSCSSLDWRARRWARRAF